MKYLFENPKYRFFPAAVDNVVDLRRHTVSLLGLRPSTGMRSLSPRPRGSVESHMAGRLLASVMPKRCFPTIRHKLQSTVPSSPPNDPSDACPARTQESIEIEIEIVYNNTRSNQLLSLGPPRYATHFLFSGD
jgi:hypothetical protein